MVNLSSLSRAEQVLERLKSANGQWVDGSELATAAVGGSEGLKRLRELREDDHWDIRKRRKEGSSQFQYRLVMIDGVPQKFDAFDASRTYDASIFGASRIYETGQEPRDVPAPEPAETYDYRQPGYKPPRGHLGKTPDGKYVYVTDEPPVPEGQVKAFDDEVDSVALKYNSMPSALELGTTVPCQRCNGYRRAIRERDPVTNKQLKNGKIIGYEELSRDPHKPSQTCPRCNGFGVVPNG